MELTHETPCDPAELYQAAADDRPEDHILEAMCPRCGHAVDAVCPVCRGNVEAAGVADKTDFGIHLETYAKLLRTIEKWKNPRFTVRCYYLATGSAACQGATMAGVAREFGKTKAAVSKRCRELVEELRIPRSIFMRSVAACEHNRLANRTTPRKKKSK